MKPATKPAMQHVLRSNRLSRALACLVLLPAGGVAFAQQPPTPAAASTQAAAAAGTAASPALEATQLDTILVQGDIFFRNRTDDIAPVLSYDLQYFQPFEPLTVGDMLKRVPGVAFVSDILEYDGAQLRGLDPGYTQILVNGKTVPGAGSDRSFFVDRIPAELVERIEIIRSGSANRSGDAVAGALNIVLRDAYQFDGSYLRAGALYFDDGEFKPTLGAVASGNVAGGRAVGALNVQGRYNPKLKQSLRYESPGGDFVNREDQTDVRDGTDYSGNVSWARDFGTSKLALDALYIKTDRTQTEHSVEFNDRYSTSLENRLSVNDQVVDIDQDTLTLGADYAFDMAGGRTDIDLGYASFEEGSTDVEQEMAFDDDESPPVFDEFEGTKLLSDIKDAEFNASVSHKRPLGATTLQFGIDYNDKQRDTRLRTSEVDTDEESAPLPPFNDFDTRSSRIDEQRLDPYVMVSGHLAAVDVEAGLRYESTRVTSEADGVSVDNDYAALLPSINLKWNLTDRDRVGASFGRTVRRPNFDQVLPLLLEEEYGDNDFLGNPQLDPEYAWGMDLGYEHRLGKRGVVGVNVFYRVVQDLIEVVNTGVPSATAVADFDDAVEEFLDENPGASPATPGYPQFEPDSFVYTAANVGDGDIFGVEFDLSTPLTAIGLPDTGVFLNYSWLDSKVDDAFGARRFNNQARSVLNVGFIQDIKSWGASFGASYRHQGDAASRLIGEEVVTTYGADLELFVEKRFSDSFLVRLTGSNLLDASKDETFRKFNTLDDQLARDYDEYERERETAGPVYQLVARYAF